MRHVTSAPWRAAHEMLRCRMLRAIIAGLITLVMATFSESAAAEAKDAEAPKDSAARIAAAQALFEQGRALLAQDRAEDACPKLEESQRLDPGLGTQFNLADCYERLGKLASAYALFTEVAATARATDQERREQIARSRADAVRSRLTRLVISVPAGAPPELSIERNGAEVGRGQWDFPVPVDPGVHRVRALSATGFEWSTEITVPSDGGVHRVTIPVSDERSFFGPLPRKLGLVALGVSVIGLSVGTYFGVDALIKKNDASQAGCDGRVCRTSEGGELREQARRAGNIATVAMGMGVASLATAAVLFWVVSAPDAESQVGELELAPLLEARGGGLLFRGQF